MMSRADEGCYCWVKPDYCQVNQSSVTQRLESSRLRKSKDVTIAAVQAGETTGDGIPPQGPRVTQGVFREL